jgi:hypothetical protein
VLVVSDVPEGDPDDQVGSILPRCHDDVADLEHAKSCHPVDGEGDPVPLDALADRWQ